MKINIIDVRGTWRQVADAARTTVGKDLGEGEPSDEWKKKITRAEHSPIRLIEFLIKVEDVKSWITVHNVRHKIGIEHFVATQRTDRTGVDRDDLPQSSLVDYQFCVNLQELMTICRKRFCNQASKETSEFWKDVIDELASNSNSKETIRPILELFVPDCIYRGGRCAEMKPCGLTNTEECKLLVDKFYN